MNLDRQFQQLIEGEIKYQSANLSLNLLISRLQRKYSSSQTPAEMQQCLQEMKAFFEKYASIVAKDAEALSKL